MLKKAWEYFKQFWHFTWYGEGALSWFTCLIVSFVLIKYVFYPVLGLIFGSPYPIVAVISGSMEHKSSLDDWWNGFTCCENTCIIKKIQSELYFPIQLTLEDFKKYPFKNGFNKGDIMIVSRPTNIKVGDIIVFKGNQKFDPVIHRVIKIKENGKVFKTKGDANCGIHDFEENIPKENVFGKAVFKIPYLGWLKLGFVSLLEILKNQW
ncbi:signal peptidase I [Candidatus Woesearchaeota archaeon]|nr:signal peptidase I [Candidatus Woesearchaeota archaeon]